MQHGSQYYGKAIWTNHALERLGQRGLSQYIAWQTLTSPDRAIPGKNNGTMEFQKQFGTSLVTVIAKKNDKGEWIVLSNWIDPPLPGTLDYYQKEEYKKYQKAGFWGKFWFTLKKQLFG